MVHVTYDSCWRLSTGKKRQELVMNENGDESYFQPDVGLIVNVSDLIINRIDLY